MVTKLSDIASTISFVASPQSPDKAGLIKQWGGTSANIPPGWAECDGAAISRTEFPQLFAAMGTKYGVGDGSTTFNLPNGPRRTQDIDLDFSGPNVQTITTAKGFAIQDTLGIWRLGFNLSFTSPSAGVSAVSNVIAGVSYNQSNEIAGGNFASSSGRGEVRTDDTVALFADTANASWKGSGNVVLSSQPTDAFVGADPRFSTFDEALESIPIIKLNDDSGNIAVEALPATETKAGVITLSSDFAASETQYGLVRANRKTQKDLAINENTPITDISTNGDPANSDFRFDNLVVGRTYVLQMNPLLFVSGSSVTENIVLTAIHDGSPIANAQFRADQAGDFYGAHVYREKQFIATADNITFNLSIGGVGQMNAAGDTTIALIELNNFVEANF